MCGYANSSLFHALFISVLNTGLKLIGFQQDLNATHVLKATNPRVRYYRVHAVYMYVGQVLIDLHSLDGSSHCAAGL